MARAVVGGIAPHDDADAQEQPVVLPQSKQYIQLPLLTIRIDPHTGQTAPV